MTGELRKLHNKKCVVFHLDEMGGACCVTERDQKCIDCKTVVGTSKRKRRLDVMMDPNQTERFFVVPDTHQVVCYIYARNTSGAGIPTFHWHQEIDVWFRASAAR
jgi:hypothetical protein